MKWIKTLFYFILLCSFAQFFLSYHGLNAYDFLDPVSVLIVLSGLVFSLWHFSLSELIQALGQAMGHEKFWLVSPSAEAGQRVFKTLGDYAFLAGLLGTFLGVIQSLGTHAQTSALGTALAVSTLSLLYGVILKYLIFTPLSYQIGQEALKREV